MTTVSKVLAVAKAEVGTHETRSGGHWVNDSKYNKWYGPIPGYGRNGYDYPYCAVYVAWVAAHSGAGSLYPKTAGCATAVAWYKRQGRFSEYPAIGAQVFYGAGGNTHTGIVHDYDSTYIYTYEGNTNTNGSAEGDGVYARKRTRRDAFVYGYGYPKFPEGIKSADPAWADKGPDKAADKPATPADSTHTKENSVELKDNLSVGQWMKDRWGTDSGLQDGITVATALSSGYGQARKAADNSDLILAKLSAQAATIDKLVDAVAKGQAVDLSALKAEIRAAIESVSVRLTTEA